MKYFKITHFAEDDMRVVLILLSTSWVATNPLRNESSVVGLPVMNALSSFRNTNCCVSQSSESLFSPMLLNGYVGSL